VSATGAYATDSVEGLATHVRIDGWFNAAAWAAAGAGLVLLWRAAVSREAAWSGWVFVGALVLGAGIFNTIDSVVNHFLLGLHHIREGPDAPAWDAAWLVLSVATLLAGAAVLRWGRGQVFAAGAVQRSPGGSRRRGAALLRPKERGQ
jgi:uncharacterized membrane protein